MTQEEFDLLKIQSLGVFFSTHLKNLFHIEHFHNLVNLRNNTNQGLEIKPFIQFLIDFRVARNVVKGKYECLLQETMQIMKTPITFETVDKFASHLKKEGITHNGKKMISLASKILFLINPVEFIPIDTMNRKALKIKNNDYVEFMSALQGFKRKHKDEFINLLEIHKDYLSLIEKRFSKVENLEKVRLNRYMDNLLWVAGQQGICLI